MGNLNPVWNEIMSFDITNGREVLVAKVFDRAERVGADALIGQCMVPVETLDD
jgi:Ca2+-dependent lipid-binding protein